MVKLIDTNSLLSQNYHIFISLFHLSILFNFFFHNSYNQNYYKIFMLSSLKLTTSTNLGK
jgi:hypothetical protein